MDADICGLPGNESARRIPMSVDLTGLDDLLEAFPTNGRIVDDRGFTKGDIMKMRDIECSRASAIINKLLNDGKIKHIGRRSGRNGAKVFEIIK